jgi:hypothetical protein
MTARSLDHIGHNLKRVGNEVVVGAKLHLYIYGWKAGFPNCAQLEEAILLVQKKGR